MNRAIVDYLHYTDTTASPQSYHTWVFLSLISSILGKKAWVKFGYFNIFPNLYVILASQPGVGRKSTAIDIGMSVLRDSKAQVCFSNDNQSSQALMLEMQGAERLYEYEHKKFFKHSSLTVIADELVSLLSQGAPMVDFLTTIYSKDKDFEYKTKNSGNLKIMNPCLGILAGCTTDTLNHRVMKDATAGGLISRCDIIYDNNIRTTSMFDELEPSQYKARENVVNRLSQVADLYGEFTFTPEAKKRFKEFEMDEAEKMKRNSANAEFRSRKPTKTIKVAMLLAASELLMTIDEQTVEIAIEVMNRVEHNMRFIYMAAGNNKNANTHTKILTMLHAVDEPISVDDLVEYLMGDATQEEIEEACAMLIKVKYIDVKNVVNKDGSGNQIISLTKKGKEVCTSI